MSDFIPTVFGACSGPNQAPPCDCGAANCAQSKTIEVTRNVFGLGPVYLDTVDPSVAVNDGYAAPNLFTGSGMTWPFPGLSGAIPLNPFRRWTSSAVAYHVPEHWDNGEDGRHLVPTIDFEYKATVVTPIGLLSTQVTPPDVVWNNVWVGYSWGAPIAFYMGIATGDTPPDYSPPPYSFTDSFDKWDINSESCIDNYALLFDSLDPSKGYVSVQYDARIEGEISSDGLVSACLGVIGEESFAAMAWGQLDSYRFNDAPPVANGAAIPDQSGYDGKLLSSLNSGAAFPASYAYYGSYGSPSGFDPGDTGAYSLNIAHSQVSADGQYLLVRWDEANNGLFVNPLIIADAIANPDNPVDIPVPPLVDLPVWTCYPYGNCDGSAPIIGRITRFISNCSIASFVNANPTAKTAL